MPGYSDEFHQLRVAKSWGLTPAQWRMQSVDDRALMIAFDGFEGTIENYKMEYREDRRERKDGKGGDRDAFKAMRHKMGLA